MSGLFKKSLANCSNCAHSSSRGFMGKKKKKAIIPNESQIVLDIASDPFEKPSTLEEEFPRIKKSIPTIISKIVTCREREIYVIRVHCIGSKVIKEPPKFVYSSWEIPRTGSKYKSYTLLNNINLARIDTEYLSDGDSAKDYNDYSKNLAYEAISLASPEAYKFGKKANGFINLRLKET